MFLSPERVELPRWSYKLDPAGALWGFSSLLHSDNSREISRCVNAVGKEIDPGRV